MDLGNLVTVLFGLCFVAAATYAWSYMGRFIETAQEASGVVVEVVYEPGSRESRMHPVVRFKTIEGKEVVGRSWQHYNSEVGQKLPLLYDPRNPEHVEIGTLASARRWQMIVTAICALFGLVICFIGIGLELGILNWRPTAYRR